MPDGVSTMIRLAMLFLVATVAHGENKHREPGPHAASQALENPIEMNEASARQGRRIFQRFCVSCHGIDGNGQTDMAANLRVPLPDFTSGEWKYGGTDGEIFSLIRNGTPNGMDAYGERITEQRTWHLVNYIRTFAPKADIHLEAEEVPEALCWMGYVTPPEAPAWSAWLKDLRAQGRAALEQGRWFATEASRDPKTVLRGRMEALGPVHCADPLMHELERDGLVLRIPFEGAMGWCDRRLRSDGSRTGRWVCYFL